MESEQRMIGFLKTIYSVRKSHRTIFLLHRVFYLVSSFSKNTQYIPRILYFPLVQYFSVVYRTISESSISESFRRHSQPVLAVT